MSSKKRGAGSRKSKDAEHAAFYAERIDGFAQLCWAFARAVCKLLDVVVRAVVSVFAGAREDDGVVGAAKGDGRSKEATKRKRGRADAGRAA